MQDTECCPKFDPAPWDEKVFDWNQKMFIKDSVRTFFYMPFGFGRAMTRLMRRIDSAKAANPDGLCLCEHTSKWNMDLYLAVNKPIPTNRLIMMNGKYLCKVYEGSFNNINKWMADFAKYTTKHNFFIKKTYLWYTTCPKCAKKQGKNYVVIVAHVD